MRSRFPALAPACIRLVSMRCIQAAAGFARRCKCWAIRRRFWSRQMVHCDRHCISRKMDIEQTQVDADDRRWLAIWEIVSVLTSALIADWVVLSFAGSNKLIASMPVALALTFMIFSHCKQGETLPEIGFRLDNFLSAARSEEHTSELQSR